MNRRPTTLRQIMSSWAGQHITLKSINGRTCLKQPSFSRKLSPDCWTNNGLNIRSRMTQNSRLNDKQNVGDQFIVRPKSKSRSPFKRVSLADLGQLYNTSRLMTDRSAKKNRYSEMTDYRSSRTNSSSNLHLRPTQPITISRNYQTQRQPFNATPSQKPQIGRLAQCTQQPSSQMSQLMDSIAEIKLPPRDQYCPAYEEVNDKFERMKKEIINKLAVSGQLDEMQCILGEIREAADRIISKHCPATQGPKMKKNVFSFKDELEKVTKEAVVELGPGIRGDNVVVLPQFKDETGNISSISSLDEVRQNDSKEEDIIKPSNIYIKDLHNASGSSIKPITLPTLTAPTADPTSSLTQPCRSSQQPPAPIPSTLPDHPLSYQVPRSIYYQPAKEISPGPLPSRYSQLTQTTNLRFRRKEEVVKHLVANHIVEKESASIEY